MKTTTASTMLAFAVCGAAFAQNAATEQNAISASAAKDDIEFVLAGGYAHFFEADFDTGGGAVSVDRGFGSVSMRG